MPIISQQDSLGGLAVLDNGPAQEMKAIAQTVAAAGWNEQTALP